MQGDGDGHVSQEEVTNYLNLQGATGALEQDIKRCAGMPLAEIRAQLADVQKRLAIFRRERARKTTNVKADISRGSGVKIGPCELAEDAVDVANFLSDPAAAYVCKPCTTCDSAGRRRTVESAVEVGGDKKCADCRGGGEITTVDAIIADFAAHDQLALLRGKIVIVDLAQDNEGIKSAGAGAKTAGSPRFPCEIAALAQRHGAAAMIFVYAGDDAELRGAMLPLSSLNSVWIPAVAITIESMNGVLVRSPGKGLRFNPGATGDPIEAGGGDDLLTGATSMMTSHDEKSEPAEHLLTTGFTAQIICASPASPASQIQVGDRVVHRPRTGGARMDESNVAFDIQQSQLEFFKEEEAIVIAKFTDRQPAIGVCTVRRCLCLRFSLLWCLR